MAPLDPLGMLRSDPNDRLLLERLVAWKSMETFDGSALNQYWPSRGGLAGLDTQAVPDLSCHTLSSGIANNAYDV